VRWITLARSLEILKGIEQNKLFWKYKRKCALGIGSSLHEEGGGDDQADREHERRQGWVPRVRDGTGDRFRRLRKQKQTEKDLRNRKLKKRLRRITKKHNPRKRLEIKRFTITSGFRSFCFSPLGSTTLDSALVGSGDSRSI
jgi:hypothetical protein